MKNVKKNSHFLVTVGTKTKRRTFVVDVVDIVPSGDTTEYHLQNLNQNFDQRFTAAKLFSHMRRGGLELL